MSFSRPKKAIGLDIGAHSIKAVLMSRSGGRLCVEEVGYQVVDRNEINSDPVMAYANAVREALRLMPTAQALVVAAMPGQTAVIRYPRLKDVPKDQLADAVQREAGQNIPYDLSEVFLDWTLLEETEEAGQRMQKVLLVAAKHEVIDSRIQILSAAEVQCGVLGVDSLAVADAAEACDIFRVGETVALLNIGHSSASIHFVKDGVSNFIRDVNWGGRELIQAIAKDQKCDLDEAERRLRKLADDLINSATANVADVADAVETLPEAKPVPPAQSGSFGGGSLLDPLDDEFGGLDDALGAPPPPPFGPKTAKPVESSDPKAALHAPLARMVAEVRRSFDFYEHQLYERPVDRLVLTGGVARLPIVGETLLDELGVETVEVAVPTSSPLLIAGASATAPLYEHPAQFMVAIGLAARGMADL